MFCLKGVFLFKSGNLLRKIYLGQQAMFGLERIPVKRGI